MENINNRLRFTGEAEATVYFYSENVAEAMFSADRQLAYIITDSLGNRLSEGISASLRFDFCGGRRLTFLKNDAGAATVELSASDGAVPYLMPGVGVLWEHGGVFPLLLDRGVPHSVWLVSAEADAGQAVAVVKGIDYGEDAVITSSGEVFTADWYPKLTRPWFWHSAELPSASVIRFDFPKGKSDIRFTAYNRSVAALLPPAVALPFGGLVPQVRDGDGKPLDARVEVFVGDERVALCDRLTEDSEPIYLPFGKYRIRASHGMFFGTDEVEAVVGEATQTVEFTLSERIKLPDGWLLGELHTHSALEDATLFPRQVMRAARANGRQFCFMTDKDVALLHGFGLHECDKDGVFAAFPGQEIMCHELHTNVLNPSRRIDNPEAEDLTAVNFNIEEKIAGWLAEYREMKKDRPCLIMHNHPTHRAEVAKRGNPYFRSWWVSDMFSEDYRLVENCGFEGWFDRLNRGKKMYAAWTGDGHDCTLMYPGMEGVCVYTGGELTADAVIAALEAGRFFSCREPGAFIDIEKLQGNRVRLTVKSAIPIEKAEIVANGKVAHSLEGGECELCGEYELPAGTRWCMARVKLSGGNRDEKRYSFTPFMEAGFAAFTNPIFTEEN